MPETGSDFGWLFPFTLWEHRAKLRRENPFVFWTSVALVLGILAFVAWVLISRWI